MEPRHPVALTLAVLSALVWAGAALILAVEAIR